MIDTELFELQGVRRAGNFIHVLRVVNPAGRSLGACQPAAQKQAFLVGEKGLFGFRMPYARYVCVGSSSHALISLYLYKPSCCHSLSQVFACCLDASGKAAPLSDRETTGRLWLISAWHPESRVYLIMVSFQNPSERAGMILVSFRPGLGQPCVPTCVFSVPICNWNLGAQGSPIFKGEELQWFPLKSLFFPADGN